MPTGPGHSGYAHAEYAHALREFGQPFPLEASGGWLLSREISGTTHRDLMGCYPIFSCSTWSGLPHDLQSLATLPADEAPVCVSMVLDPLGEYQPDQLPLWFPDLCRPFKDHFLVDLQRDPAEFVSAHHRRNAKKSLKKLDVDVVDQPSAHVDEWCQLYDALIERHGITGISAFSRESFALQVETPGLTMLRARLGEQTVGMVLWYSQGERAYYHLAAYSEAGYEAKASFAIFWRAIEHFSGILRWLSLGASAGIDGDASDGLSRFKKGWSTDSKTAYLCGRIIHPSIYDGLSPEASSGYFPAYRAGEFS